MARIIIPIPVTDFDPTEVAVPWQALVAKGHDVQFATPNGLPGRADEIMLTGRGLDLWGFVPGVRRLILVGGLLRANLDARRAYSRMAASNAFQHPRVWEDVRLSDFDGLLLPGGHRARGMKAYLESDTLQQLTVAFFNAGKPVGAICHGVLLAARSIDPETGRSVLYGRKTTALTWALERSAASLARIVRFWDPFYYRTYRERQDQGAGYMSVEQEVTRALRSPADFMDVPKNDADVRLKTSGLARDAASDHRSSFVVRDGAYVSARWPGDAHAFAKAFAEFFT